MFFGAGTMLLMIIEGKNLLTQARSGGLYTLRLLDSQVRCIGGPQAKPICQ
jgi:hypothetical protein